MDSEKLDLTPLDPSRDAMRWEQLVARITERAQPELARRSSHTGVLSLLGNWAWPTLAAAGVAAILSGAALALARTNVQADDNSEGIVHALGLPETVTSWLDAERPPTTSDLILVLEGESR
jgi:hypothetical protein